MNRIGILGGSFDPIHEAHISLAKDALLMCELDKVIFVPANIQPFKLDNYVTSASDRFAMVKEAISDVPGMEVSDYEISSQGVSYSYITMRAMREKYKDAELFFITGTDAFLMIEQWRESEEMLDNYSYIVGTRPGYKEKELNECMTRINSKYGTFIVNIENVQLDISSTEIRNRVAHGLSLSGLVPSKVEEYIKKNNLYR